MAKYKVMLIYAFLFLTASMSFSILGANMTYELANKRIEDRPKSVATGPWEVQRITKGHPPVRIVTRVETRDGKKGDYTNTSTRQIHWFNIVGVIIFSAFMSGTMVFIGAAIISFFIKK